jgi:acetyltransferase
VSVAPVAKLQRGPSGHPRFAIRPYPKEWERRVTLPDGTTLLVRPVRPEDESLYPPFFAAVTQQDLRLRFFAPVKEFSHTFIARVTQIDYARHGVHCGQRGNGKNVGGRASAHRCGL